MPPRGRAMPDPTHLARPWIALVGRANVGKSTLFNRLVGKRTTVVSSTKGTTRDRVYGRAEWTGVPFTVIDAGGFDFAAREDLPRAVQAQLQRVLEDADAFLFVCSAQDGLVGADEMILKRLHTTGKPIVLAVNKADHRPVVPPDFFSLGLEQPCAISALHGHGTGDLLDQLLRQAVQGPREPDASDAQRPVAVAIVGRQNVGKSSLLNALLREERVIVSETPGTTRDAVAHPLLIDGQPVQLIDTAGLRHRRKVKDPVDVFSMSRTIEAIERCDVALVVLDATQGITRDDRRILTTVSRRGRGLVLLVNKWDLVTGLKESKLIQGVRRLAPDVAFAPVLAVSAKTGFQVPHSLSAMLRLARAMRRPMTDIDCTALLRATWQTQTPPRVQGRAIRLERARWVPGPPVRIEIATSPIGSLPIPYQRYLLKRLHAHPRLTGIPLTLAITGPMPRVARRSASVRKGRSRSRR